MAEAEVPRAPERAEAALRSYLALLRRWNSRVDLVGPDTDARWWELHVLDSLGALAGVPDDARTALDVGSGAGLPGLVWSLARPSLSVTLLEPRRRRVAFLRAAVRETGAGAAVLHGRAGDVRGRTFDVVVGRAVAPYADFVAMAAPLARPGGVVLCLLTPTTPEGWGVAEAQAGLVHAGESGYRLPGIGAVRRVVALRRAGAPCDPGAHPPDGG